MHFECFLQALHLYGCFAQARALLLLLGWEGQAWIVIATGRGPTAVSGYWEGIP